MTRSPLAWGTGLLLDGSGAVVNYREQAEHHGKTAT